MIEKSELLRVPAFADLPDDQIAWFLSHSEEMHLKAGETYVRQGDPADAMFVILEGQFQWRGEFGGETVVLPGKPGDVTGVLPFSRMKQFTVTGRAMTDGRVLKFPTSLFSELVQKMPELTQRLVGLMSDRIREATRIEQQRDRLASLGKLSAGLAHELNNPASAAKRATSQLRDILKKIKNASLELGRRDLTSAQKAEIEKLEALFTQKDIVPPDALTVSDLEDQIDSLLRSHGQNDLWQLAADLARRNIKPEVLESLFASLDADTARAAQVWTNIIDNAIDAMGGKGELRVRTFRDDGCVVVEIGDSGPGISSEVEPHIFEPFFTTKGVGEGTGLGLDTVQRIVKKHRGSIQVDSKPGDTRFQVWLPLAEAPAS